MQSTPRISPGRRFARNVTSLAAGGVVAQVAFVLIEVVLARQLGAATYGIFSISYSVCVFALIVTDLGIDWWIVQEGSRDRAKLPVLLGNALRLKGTLVLITYLSAIAVVWAIDSPTELKVFLTVFALFVPGMSVSDTLAAVFSAEQRMHVNAVFQALAPLTVLICALAAYLLAPSLIGVGASYAVGMTVVATGWLAWTVREHQVAGDFRGALRMAAESYHYALFSGLSQVFSRIDIVLLAWLAGPIEAGLYAAGFKFVDLFYKVPVLLGRVMAPALFVSSRKPDREEFHGLVSAYARGLVLAGVVASVITWSLADEIVGLLFGDQYADSAQMLQILSVLMALKCMASVSQWVLSSLDKHALRWGSMAVCVACSIGLSVLLIPRLGSLGAAYATVASNILLVLLQVTGGFGRKLARDAYKWFLVPAGIAAAVLLLVVALPIDSHVLSTVCAVILTSAALIATRYIRVGEVHDILRAFARMRAARAPHSDSGNT